MKIGYVNLAKVFDGYERTKAQDAALEKRGKAKEAELEARVNALKKIRQSLELLNDAAREAKSREVEEQSEELQRFRASTARDLRRDRDKLAQEILKDIQKAIDEYAKANGFALILDQRGLFYAQSGYDVTDGVLKLLNSRLAAPAAQGR
ncbi:MAG: OmpH family outer membrane protein [Candidatus Omnitrophica bacterium]|nr:OmpH family outer membrane protein [Candidatus Omnitrophota bacterium]